MQHAARPHAIVAATLAALFTGALVGCAHGAPKMTFEEAGFALPPSESPEPAGEEAPLPPPAPVPAPETIALELPQGPPIDATLVRFSAEARARRFHLPARRGFPIEVVVAWRSLMAELDRYLQRPLPQTPFLELVRARVTIEAEWDFDRRRFGTPPRETRDAVARRTVRLARRMESARALGFSLFTSPPPAKLHWPVERAGLSSLFGMRLDPLEGKWRMHYGVDLVASPGKVVSAAAPGWVIRAGWAGGYGLLVEVRHPGNVTTRYGHLSAILCAPGDAVDADQPLGLVGRTGHATGPHLHFEVWRAGEPSDPLPWLGMASTKTTASGLANR